MHNHVCVTVSDSSQIGEARRAAMAVASEARLNDVDAGKLSIIVNELASNIIKHAEHGEVLIGNVRGRNVVDVIALDQGPGIRDLEHAMRDGFSSAGTMGQGLGAVKRQSSFRRRASQLKVTCKRISRLGDYQSKSPRTTPAALCG